MDTVEALDHLNGHLLNWYDTTTLEPLHAVHLDGRQRQPGEPPHRRRQHRAASGSTHPTPTAPQRPGFDGLALLRASCAEQKPRRRPARRARSIARRLPIGGVGAPRHDTHRADSSDRGASRRDALRDDSSERSVWATATLAALDGQQCDAQAQPDWSSSAMNVSPASSAGCATGPRHGLRLPLRPAVAGCCRSATRPTRNVSTSCYDLLASEARVASYVAIAKGDVQTRHWFRLGRTVTPVPPTPHSSPGQARCSST